MGEEGGVKNLKKWVTSFMNGPCLLICNSLLVFRDEIEKKLTHLATRKNGFCFSKDWILFRCCA